MHIHRLRGHVVIMLGALFLITGGLSSATVENASAQPNPSQATSCFRLKAAYNATLGKIEETAQKLDHLLEGGVTADEVAFVNALDEELGFLTRVAQENKNELEAKCPWLAARTKREKVLLNARATLAAASKALAAARRR